MSDDRQKLVERYTSRAPKAEATKQEPEQGYQAASPVSANRPPECMLEFRLKAGDSVALSYSLMISATFNASMGIALEFTSHKVAISGRNLRGMYRAIVDHRLTYIQELATPLDDQPNEAVVVTAVQISCT